MPRSWEFAAGGVWAVLVSLKLQLGSFLLTGQSCCGEHWIRGLIIIITTIAALAGVARWTEQPVRVPVRTHAWIEGQVPSRGCVSGNHKLMFPSLLFSLPSLLSKRK